MKTSSHDFWLTKFFSDSINYEKSTLQAHGSLEGVWSKSNFGSDRFLDPTDKVAQTELEVRREYGTPLTFSNGRTGRQYHFILRLDTILSTLSRPLPKDATLEITLHRAPAKTSLISLTLDSEGNGTDNGSLKNKLDYSLPLHNPILKCHYYESDYYNNKLMNRKISKVPYPFIEKSTRVSVLASGQDSFRYKISDGKFLSIHQLYQLNKYIKVRSLYLL